MNIPDLYAIFFLPPRAKTSSVSGDESNEESLKRRYIYIYPITTSFTGWVTWRVSAHLLVRFRAEGYGGLQNKK